MHEAPRARPTDPIDGPRKPRPHKPHRRANGRPPIDQAAVDEIRRLSAEGLSHRKIEAKVDISRGTIQAILSGRRRDYRPPEAVAAVAPGTGPVGRCTICGAKVKTPCVRCTTLGPDPESPEMRRARRRLDERAEGVELGLRPAEQEAADFIRRLRESEGLPVEEDEGLGMRDEGKADRLSLIPHPSSAPSWRTTACATCGHELLYTLVRGRTRFFKLERDRSKTLVRICPGCRRELPEIAIDTVTEQTERLP